MKVFATAAHGACSSTAGKEQTFHMYRRSAVVHRVRNRATTCPESTLIAFSVLGPRELPSQQMRLRPVELATSQVQRRQRRLQVYRKVLRLLGAVHGHLSTHSPIDGAGARESRARKMQGYSPQVPGMAGQLVRAQSVAGGVWHSPVTRDLTPLTARSGESWNLVSFSDVICSHPWTSRRFPGSSTVPPHSSGSTGILAAS